MNKSKRVDKSCLHCGSSFAAKAAELSRGGARYCSRTCYYRGRTRDVADRFWEKVKKTNGCWLWTGALNHGAHHKWRYGIIGIGRGKSPKPAHRLSWEIHRGEIPKGMFVCHHCDTPACVRPDHLFLGVAADNSRDMVSKGRNAATRAPRPYQQGELHHSAKLTDSRVIEIRTKYAVGDVTQADLARQYGVSDALINFVVNRKVWTHV